MQYILWKHNTYVETQHISVGLCIWSVSSISEQIENVSRATMAPGLTSGVPVSLHLSVSRLAEHGCQEAVLSMPSATHLTVPHVALSMFISRAAQHLTRVQTK